MKNIYVLLLGLLIVSTSFAQYRAKAGMASDTRTTSVQKFNKAPVSQKGVKAVFLEEGFEGGSVPPAGWSIVDQDGDGFNWKISDSYPTNSGTYCAASASYDNTDGVLTPENYLISPAIDVTGVTGPLSLKYYVYALDQAWVAEHYKAVISTAGGTVTDIQNGDIVYEEILTTSTEYIERTVDISAYAGNTIYLGFVHFDCTDNYEICIDDISVYEPAADDVGITAIPSPNNDDDCILSSAENVTVTIFNYGGNAVQNFDISYSINGGAPVTETCTSSIAAASSVEFTFSATADLSSIGIYEFTANTSLSGDTDPSNDSFEQYFVYNSDATITVHVFTDSYANNNGFYIINTITDDTVAIHGAYAWDQEFSDDICVFDDSCYTVTFYDQDGDGISTGYVEILYNGTQVAGSTTTGSFTGSELIAEDLGECGQSVNNPDNFSNVKIYPNPAYDKIYVINAENTTIEIYNILGEKVKSCNIIENSSTLDLSELTQGAYFVKVIIDNNIVATQKITLTK